MASVGLFITEALISVPEPVRLGIPLVEVSQVNSAETVTALKEHRIALGVSLGNRREVFDTPSEGMINYHGERYDEPGGELPPVK
jgi:hypothetical protein